jgi:hypothetical protein
LPNFFGIRAFDGADFNIVGNNRFSHTGQ